MEYEFTENIAKELGIGGDELQKIIDRLGIKTLQTASPPSEKEVSTAVRRRDAEQLRKYCTEKVG